MFRFGGLITKNALRNQRRTTLTILSIAISIFLVSTLQAVLASIYRAGKEGTRRFGTSTDTTAYNVPGGKAVEVRSEDDFLTALVGQSVSPGTPREAQRPRLLVAGMLRLREKHSRKPTE